MATTTLPPRYRGFQIVLRGRVTLAPALPDAHDHADQDRRCHDYAEQGLDDGGAGIRAGDATLSPVSRGGGLSLYPLGVGGL